MIISQKKSLIKRLKKTLYWSGLGLIVFVIIFFTYSEKFVNVLKEDITTRTFFKSLGIGGVDKNTNPLFLIKNLSDNIYSGFSVNNSFPNLVIDMDFKNFESLKGNRERALKEGEILRSHFKRSKAKIKFKNKKLSASVRIKGVFIDHIVTDKWSLSINLKEGNILGMKKFHLQGPFTRDFHSSHLIKQAMRYKKIIAPFDSYFNVTMNGKYLGLMYIEEDYGEPFTEKSNTPYGPILKVNKSSKIGFEDNKKFWEMDNTQKLIGENIENLIANPEKYLSFINQNKWAEYLAITFLFKCGHGSSNFNLTYYFNPISQTLEPISSDNSCGSYENRPMGFLPLKQEFVYQLIGIDSFKKLLLEKINWWKTNADAKNFIYSLNKVGRNLRYILSKESPFLGDFILSTKHLDKVEKWIQNPEFQKFRADETKSAASNGPSPYFFIKRDSENKYKFLRGQYDDKRYSLNKFQIKVDKKLFEVKVGKIINDKEILIIEDLLNKVLIQEKDLSRTKIRLFYRDNKYPEIRLNVDAYLQYENKQSIKKYSTPEELKKYFSQDFESQTFFTKADSEIEIEDQLNIPLGFNLIINKGTNIVFKKDSSLTVNSSLFVRGDSSSPVRISANDKSAGGVLILANGNQVDLDGLIYTGGNGFIRGSQLRGSFTIHNAKFNIRNSSFSNNFSEDVLNIVQSDGSLDNILISDSHSDGLDVDYGNIVLTNSSFSNIGSSSGADAIDVSRTFIRISNSSANNITDKAISIGESSFAEISNFSIKDSLVGIVSKDSSKVHANYIDFADLKLYDVMAYNKKDHYDGAKLNLNSSPQASKYLAQQGSNILVDGKLIETQDFDIDRLYKVEMKSIK